MVTYAIQGDVIIGLKHPREHRHRSGTVADVLCVCVVCASACVCV